MSAFCGFEETVDIPVLKQQPTTSRKVDGEVLVDEDMRKEWDEAKETTMTLISVNEMLQHELGQAINCAMGDLVQLVEQYDRLSLAGSCSAEVRSIVSLLEALEKMDLEEDELETVKKSLGHLKRKLELLTKVEVDVFEYASVGYSPSMQDTSNRHSIHLYW